MNKHEDAVQYARYLADDRTRVSWPKYLAYVADMADWALVLREALKGAEEELRLIRMKDTLSVYDPTIRASISAALSQEPKP